MKKEKILVSFSGGETSAFMCNWLLLNKSDEFEFKFVFANTGEENEETLLFAHQCDQYFGLNLTWVEYLEDSFKIVDYKSAYRKTDEERKKGYPNHPFHLMVRKFGIPNRTFKHCTRELKEYPIQRYMRSIGWKAGDYRIAIGIRSDEIDRIGSHYYPLVHADIRKPMINNFWDSMPFRLKLKGYEGNCQVCWKKSDRKLGTIYLENPKRFDLFDYLTDRYNQFAPLTQKHRGEPPYNFWRMNREKEQVVSCVKKKGFEKAHDDSLNINYQHSILHDGTELDRVDGCIESCEIFTD